ncbi:MAG TPA: F0F1 ATP synthase subunit B [Patescibacteria group bacterium]|nr:F0F1 ATP synthase subunit B [Patescibacteria group bacterium]
MEVLGKFGINPILLLAQVVNFLIVFYIIKRYALKPILQLLKNRQDTIKKGLEQAEEAKKLLEETAEKEKAVLRKAQLEAKELIDDAKKHSTEVINQTESKAREQAEKILQEARDQISSETKEAERKLTAHISELAIMMIQKSSSELFNEKEQQQIMQKAVKSLKGKAN